MYVQRSYGDCRGQMYADSGVAMITGLSSSGDQVFWSFDDLHLVVVRASNHE